jgi:hypothetical protein
MTSDETSRQIHRTKSRLKCLRDFLHSEGFVFQVKQIQFSYRSRTKNELQNEIQLFAA